MKVAKDVFKFALRVAGYEMPKPRGGDRSFDLSEEALAAIAVVRGRTMAGYAPLMTLFQQVAHCERADIPGCYVECGVWKGGASGLMALGNMRYGVRRRHIHLFDAFDDICQPDPSVDGERAVREAEQWGSTDREALDGSLKPLTGFYDHKGGPGAVGDVQRLFDEIGYPKDHVHIHEGWFQDTMPLVADGLGPIAILRLDGDWYASTRVCLDHLYDAVVSGGFVVIDDYGAYEGCRKAVDEFLGERGVTPFLSHVNADCRYFIKSIAPRTA